MKKIDHNYAVILAGGQGSRFWPLSRSLEPKQFLSLGSTNSLLQNTISRTKKVIPAKNIFIVTSQLYFPEIFNYTLGLGIPKANIIFEPEGKNTAPSIAVASRLIAIIDPEALIVFLPSDHLITKQAGFKRLLANAFSLAGTRNDLIIFGILPGFPATGYGYVKIKNKKLKIKNKEVYQVERFIEKPDIRKAKRIFKDKRYFWNSGMFLGSASVFQREIKNELPKLYRLVSSINDPAGISKIWSKIKAVSFDYGVLEKTNNLLMLRAPNLGWSDLGTWASLDKILPKDRSLNSLNADTINLDCKNITVFGKKRLIACLGLDDLIIVDTPDALLITRKDRSEEVKKVVEKLKKSKRQEYYLHKTVKRPW
ncbi:MAG: sugar phosphate nucleotidyltransferase, partial [Candidatus Omnitrophota bacterium]